MRAFWQCRRASGQFRWAFGQCRQAFGQCTSPPDPTEDIGEGHRDDPEAAGLGQDRREEVSGVGIWCSVGRARAVLLCSFGWWPRPGDPTPLDIAHVWQCTYVRTYVRIHVRT